MYESSARVARADLQQCRGSQQGSGSSSPTPPPGSCGRLAPCPFACTSCPALGGTRGVCGMVILGFFLCRWKSTLTLPQSDPHSSPFTTTPFQQPRLLGKAKEPPPTLGLRPRLSQGIAEMGDRERHREIETHGNTESSSQRQPAEGRKTP